MINYFLLTIYQWYKRNTISEVWRQRPEVRSQTSESRSRTSDLSAEVRRCERRRRSDISCQISKLNTILFILLRRVWDC